MIMIFAGERDLSRAHHRNRLSQDWRSRRIPGPGGCHVGESSDVEIGEEIRDSHGKSLSDALREAYDQREGASTETDSQFSLTLDDLGGSRRFGNSSTVRERYDGQKGEYLGVHTFEGWLDQDPDSGGFYLDELTKEQLQDFTVEKEGTIMDFNDLFPAEMLGSRIKVEITVRVKELQEENTAD